MYCIKCGVQLADSEAKCPLCNTHVFHPELQRIQQDGLYPSGQYPAEQVRPWGALVIVSALWLLPMFITVLCNIQFSGGVTWSGYVVGGLLVSYVMLILPLWFRKPNPVIFVPCTFAAIVLFLLYINLATGGRWYLSFALPVTAGLGLILTALVTLTRYIHRGRMYIFGGTAIALGLFTLLVELLLNITFHFPLTFTWSMYPLVTLVLLGLILLAGAIFRPLGETLRKKLFI